MSCYINKINAYICCIEHLLRKYNFPHFHYCGRNIEIPLYVALEFLIDSITLYMFFLRKQIPIIPRMTNAIIQTMQY